MTGDRRQQGGEDLRRVVDIVLASLGLVLLAPLGLVISVAILVSSGPPVLYRQRRCGRDGREFLILKFRTMRPVGLAGQSDRERLIRIGSVLRASGLDELPQLVNILKGDMSLIGPRPTLPEQVRRYTPRQHGRLAVRPGLTGWAQVLGRNSLSWPDRIELDLWYIQHRSWRLDLRIVARTVASVLCGRGVVGPGGVNPGLVTPEPAEPEVRHAG